jgi:hypothetical protein
MGMGEDTAFCHHLRKQKPIIFKTDHFTRKGSIDSLKHSPDLPLKSPEP